jgi:hypothetical protein
VGPLGGRAAVAAVAVVAGAGALAFTGHDDPPSRAGTPAAEAAAPAGTSQQAVLAAAPNVVRPHRVTVVRKTGGSTPAVSVGPQAAIPVAAAPSAPATTRPDRPRSVSRDPTVRRQQAAAPQASTPAPAPPTPGAAPEVAAPAAPVAAPVAQGVGAVSAPSPVAQPVAPVTPPAQQPVSTGGPSVAQTATCLVAACRIGP